MQSVVAKTLSTIAAPTSASFKQLLPSNAHIGPHPIDDEDLSATIVDEEVLSQLTAQILIPGRNATTNDDGAALITAR